MRYFKNPSNGYVEASKGSLSWLFAFLWLELYLLAKGNFRHFLIAFFLNSIIFSFFIIPLLTLSLLGPLLLTSPPLAPPPPTPPPLAPLLLLLPLRVIYAFMIGKISAAHYLRQGWIEVADPMQQPPA